MKLLLETPRLTIRPFSEDDLEQADPLVNDDYWPGPPSLQQPAARLGWNANMARWNHSGGLFGDRALVLKSEQRVVGCCGVDPWVWSASHKRGLPELFPEQEPSTIEFELGWSLAPPYRGQGLGTEAAQAVVRYLFEDMAVGRVVARTSHENERSAAMMRRIGMRVVSNERGVWAVLRKFPDS